MKKYLKNKLKVTKPFTPEIEEMLPLLRSMLKSSQLTNRGPLIESFEKMLCTYLDVKYISLFSSGTMALTLALKALDLKGEIITTPFTHISTVQAIYWNNLQPVFIDIEKSNFTMDIAELEKAISPRTSAILPVHIFGNPCDVSAIEQIAQKHKLKVIYDAAHCFGVKLGNISIHNYGDLSMMSFHATKVFNTIEGGAVICRDEKMKLHLNALANSGIDQNHQLMDYGLNAKMNEFQAAYGIKVLDHIDEAIDKRRMATQLYRKLFKTVKGVKLIHQQENVQANYTYFPVIINPWELGVSIDELVNYLQQNNIFPERYFHPLITDYKLFQKFKKFELKNSRLISENILCLPLSHELQSDEIEHIVNLFVELTKKKIK